MTRVFVSSVSVGLEAIRAQIIVDLQTANFDIGGMERFGAQPQAPIDVCLREVRKADVVVLTDRPEVRLATTARHIVHTRRVSCSARRRHTSLSIPHSVRF